ncbi:MAG: hypothetical protein V1738_05175 [Patescibacteria group bacterium]
MKKFFYIFPLLVALLVFVAPAPTSAAVASGDLIKLVSDGDVNTQHDAAVYFVAADNKRYVFPSAKVYSTWYENFDGVHEVSQAEMASLPIGGNVTYRAGTRLIKITSDPTVYAVEPGGILRAIGSEAIAMALYGTAWNQIIDDVSDTYFINYTLSAPLAAPVYPSGAVLRRTSDNAYFYIDNGAKRRLSSEQLRTELRLQNGFIVSTDSSLATYPDGSDILTAEAELIDTSGRNAVPVSAPPTFSVRTPASTFIAVGGTVTLLELHITSGTDVTLNRLAAKIRATTNVAPAAGESDDDDGGLVYGNNAQKNLNQLSFVDPSGVEVFGHQEIALDLNQDQEQTLYFTGNVHIAAGQEKILYFKTQLNPLLPNNEGYQVTLPVTGIGLLNDAGQGATFLPASDLVGPSLMTLSDTLKVSAASSYGNKTYIRGALNVPVTGFQLKATTSAPNVVQAITFQGYIDEGNGGGMLPGSDADNGTETLVRDMFANGITLRDASGNLLAGPTTIDTYGRATFSGLNIYIAAGGTLDVILHGDVSRYVNLEESPNTVAFDVENAAVDLTVKDETGGPVPASGINPNKGVDASSRLTVRETGILEMSWLGQSGSYIAGQEVLLGNFSFKTEYDDYVVEVVTFRRTSSTLTSLGDLRLVYKNQSGETVSLDGEMIGDIVVFNGLSAWLPRDATTTNIQLYGDIFSKSGGAVYGELLGVDYATAGPFVFSSFSTKEQFDQSDFGTSEYKLIEHRPSNIEVRFSKLTAAMSASTPIGSIYRGDEEEVLQFYFSADTAGAVRVKKFAFKVISGDVGVVGADNDSLERWADSDGDTRDDDSLVNLRRLISDGTTQLFGEDSSVRLRYYIVSGGVRDATPAGRDSVSGDYAIIEYEMVDGSELFIPAGGSINYSLELDTSVFAVQDKNFSLSVQLMSEGDFLWTDVPSGAYTPLTGGAASGVGFSSSLTILQ